MIESGEIQAGDEIEIVHRPDHDVTVALTFRALLVEPDLLPRLLAADALPRELGDGAPTDHVRRSAWAGAGIPEAGWHRAS